MPDPELKLFQSLIDLYRSLANRVDTLQWRLDQTEREVLRLRGLEFTNEIDKLKVEGGRK